MKPVVVTAPESKISSKNVQQICGSKVAFAAILADRSVVTWGAKYCVGDSSRVQGQLQNVQQICSASYDFAAILADRSVVTWGDEACGGDSSRVQDQLWNVQQICGTDSAFAAILADRSVVTWGNAACGGARLGKGLSSNVSAVDLAGWQWWL